MGIQPLFQALLLAQLHLDTAIFVQAEAVWPFLGHHGLLLLLGLVPGTLRMLELDERVLAFRGSIGAEGQAICGERGQETVCGDPAGRRVMRQEVIAECHVERTQGVERLGGRWRLPRCRSGRLFRFRVHA
uniref:Putative secreted protein n=1 Tax=Ixodes ricinus TaxID=34613 RepID=A0A6B0US42_IXORI